MINPRRRTAKARSSKPLLETDNVDQRVVCTIAIIFLTFEQKVKGKQEPAKHPISSVLPHIGWEAGRAISRESQNEDCELYKYYPNATLVLTIQRKIP